MKSVLLLGMGAVLILAACSTPSAPTSAPSTASPSSSATVARIAKTPFDEAMDKLGGATVVPLAASRADALGVVAPKGELASAWLRMKDGTIEKVPDLPMGARFLGATHVTLANGERAEALFLESINAADLPAGVHGVYVDALRARFLERAYLSFQAERATLDGWSKNPGLAVPTDTGAMDRALALFRDEKRIREELHRGVDAFALAQGAFLVRERHIDDASASAVDVAAMRAIVMGVNGSHRCIGLVCEASTSGNEVGAVVFEPDPKDGKSVRLRGFFGLPAPASKAAKPGAARAVAMDPDTRATTAILATREREPTKILGQAPLDAAGGTIAVVVGAAGTAPSLVFSDRGLTGVAPLEEFVLMAGADLGDGYVSPPPVFEVRFVDSDGDGRTEAIVRGRSKPYQSEGERTITSRISTPSALRPYVLGAHREYDAVPDLARAATLDAAVASFVGNEAAPTVDAAAACGTIGGLKTKAGMARSTTSDAVLIEYYEPGMPNLLQPDSVKPLSAADPARLGAECASLECSGSHCMFLHDAPGQTWYWFKTEKGALKITGVAVYSGS
jgi:hypothetical protein